MVEINDKFGMVIHRGQNLDILGRYISRVMGSGYKENTYRDWLGVYHMNGVCGVGLHRKENRSGELHISFADGSYCNTHFNSFDVMCGWVWRKRKRSLNGVDLKFFGADGKELPAREVKLSLVRAGERVRL